MWINRDNDAERPAMVNPPPQDSGHGATFGVDFRNGDISMQFSYLRGFNGPALRAAYDLAESGRWAKSIKVKKSIVLNSRSIAGGPQILAPHAR